LSKPETFGERLRAARSRIGLSQEILATRVGSSKGYVSQLETDPDIRPSADLVLRLAIETQTTVEHLLGGEEPAAASDRAFFRSFESADPEVKAKLKAIFDVLKSGSSS
jgi:transcriptional regulator with XRE-family HTH domain